MGLINLYKGLSNEYEVIKGNGKIKDIAPELDFTKLILLDKGNTVTPDYELNDDSIILAREVPAEAVTVTALAIAGVTAITSYVAGVAIAGITSAITKKQISEAQEQAQRDAANLAQQINQFPFIKGAKNKSSIGTTISYQLGRMYDTPTLINDGFYTITDGTGENEYGKNQYYNAVLSLGNGNKSIERVYIGETEILKNNDGLPSGKNYIPNTNIYYDADNFVEVRQAGEEFDGSLFKDKILMTQDGDELKHEFGESAEPVIKQLGSLVKKLEVCIQFNGLRKYVNNDWEEKEVTVKPYWTNVENPTANDWHEFNFSGMTNNTIKTNTKNSIRFVATHEFSASDVMEIVNGEIKHKNIYLKVEKVTAKEESNSNEDCYLLYHQTTQYNPKESNLTTGLVSCPMISANLKNKLTRIAIRIKATKDTNNLLDDIHVISSALAPVYNNGAWTTTKEVTRNPAAQVLEVLTSDTHKHSKYTRDEIDLDSLAALYNYCETNNFYCDKLITSAIKKKDLVNEILATCGAVMNENHETGKLEFFIDKAEETPIALLNAEDLKDISYTKDFGRKVDGVKVTFLNAENWQIDTFYVMRNGGEPNDESLLTELNLDYVTTYQHAYKLALRGLKAAYLQPREVRANVGAQGDSYPLFSTVLVQYKEFRIGLGSSVITKITKTGDSITAFSIADEFTFENGKNYGAIIEAVTQYGKRLIYVKITQGDTKKDFNCVTNIDGAILPELFNSVSIGELDESGNFSKITNKMKIYGLEPDGSNGYVLQLKDYNESIYTTGAIPTYVSNITRVPKPANTIPDPDAKGLNGESGYNTRTIELYIRSESRPQDFPFSFTQVFSHSSVDATEQQLNGWSVYRPEIREDNAPMWAISQTQVSKNSAVEFLNENWAASLVKCSQDTTVTKDEIQDMINNMKDTSAPSVYASCTFASVAVDENDRVTIPQTFESTVHVLQAGEDIEFSFEDFELPDGWEVSHVGNKLTFTVKQGALVTGGNIEIKVKYRAFVSLVNYADENNDLYCDEESELYGANVLAEEATIYTLGFGYSIIKGGRYLNSIYGAINTLAKIPSSDDLVLGDYFTWTGADTTSALSSESSFLKSAVYVWHGDLWQKTNDPRHLMPALKDVLSVANDKLATNNSDVVGLFDEVVSNEVVASTLTVTGKAFMNKVIANVVSANTFVSYVDGKANTAQSNAISAAASDATQKSTAAKTAAIAQTMLDLGFTESDDVTIIDGGKIKTSFIKTDEIVIGDLSGYSTLENTVNSKSSKTEAQGYATTAQNNAASDATTKADNALDSALTQLVGANNVRNHTIISGGKILTKFIKTDEIVIGNLSGYSDLETTVNSKSSKEEAQGYADTAESNAKTAAGNYSETAKNAAIENALIQMVGSENVRDYTIITGGKIKTGLVDVDAIKATAGFFEDIQVTGCADFSGGVSVRSTSSSNINDFIDRIGFVFKTRYRLNQGSKIAIQTLIANGVLNFSYVTNSGRANASVIITHIEATSTSELSCSGSIYGYDIRSGGFFKFYFYYNNGSKSYDNTFTLGGANYSVSGISWGTSTLII